MKISLKYVFAINCLEFFITDCVVLDTEQLSNNETCH